MGDTIWGERDERDGYLLALKELASANRPIARVPSRKFEAYEMKAELAAYWRYKRGMRYVGVEADHMDVMAANDNCPPAIVETEVKVSIDDLRADASKEKHRHIESELRGELYDYDGRYTPRRIWTPTRFFFAVPHYLTEKALPVVQNLYPYAGLLSVVSSCGPASFGCAVRVVLRGKLIRRDQSQARVRWALREQASALVRELGHVVVLKQALKEGR